MSEEEGAHSFAHQVATLCEGEANEAISDEMFALLQSLRAEASARRKQVKGTLKVELFFVVDDNDTVGITYSVKKKAPEPRRQSAHMWLTKGGNLSPENPRQQKLPLREVNGDRRPLREVEDAEVKEA